MTHSTDGNRRKLAFLIGNGDYEMTENRIETCLENTNRLATHLRGMDFQVEMYENRQSKGDMVTCINEFVNLIEDGDLVLSYYCGHGCHSNGTNYLLPTSDKNIKKEDDIQDYALKMDSLLDRLTDKSSSYANVVILDCSRPYQLSTGSTTKGLQVTKTKPGIFLQFACASGETAADDFFINSLLKSIGEENIDMKELFKRISQDVYEQRNQTRKPLCIDQLNLNQPLRLNEVPDDLPNIPQNATWTTHGSLVIGSEKRNPERKKLDQPKGIWIKSDKTVLLADTQNHRIVECNEGTPPKSIISNGKYISKPFELRQLSRPTNIAFNQTTNSLFICDSGNRRVLQFSSPSSTDFSIPIKDIACYGIAIDNKGNIYISDTENHAVRQYSPGDRHGVIVAGGNKRGSRTDQLDHPTYICMGPNQSIYVSDSQNNRVMRWDKGAKKGVVVAGGNGKGKKTSQLDHPTGIVVDRCGTLYVADHWNNRVMRWPRNKSNGDIIVGRLRPEVSPKQINGPEGLRFDKEGNLYIVNGSDRCVRRFRIVKP